MELIGVCGIFVNREASKNDPAPLTTPLRFLFWGTLCLVAATGWPEPVSALPYLFSTHCFIHQQPVDKTDPGLADNTKMDKASHKSL